MKTYEEIADSCKMAEGMKARYIQYMRARWGKPEEEDRRCVVGYAQEWAERFKAGVEFNCSDNTGQAILKGMNKEVIK